MAAGRARLLQGALCLDRGVALVNGVNRQLILVQFADECLHGVLHFTRGSVRMAWHADDETGWLPFVDKRRDRAVVDTLVTVGNSAEGAG